RARYVLRSGVMTAAHLSIYATYTCCNTFCTFTLSAMAMVRLLMAIVKADGPQTMSRTSLFSRQAWDRNASIYEVIRTMPFNAQLASGTLSEARFKHYITQDAHYLIGFGRALTLAAAKAPNPDRIVQFAKAAEGALVVE